MTMKKTLTLLTALALLVGCASALAETEIIVFAAASMTETLTQIKALYEAAHPETDLVFNFDFTAVHRNMNGLCRLGKHCIRNRNVLIGSCQDNSLLRILRSRILVFELIEGIQSQVTPFLNQSGR